jgi:hypothetical protein
MQAVAQQQWSQSVEVSRSQLLKLFPSLTDFAFLFPLVILFGFLHGGAYFLFADGDIGWHIRTGDWIAAHKTIPRTDLFSYTKPNAQWFAWEWGCDVLFSWIHSLWGLAGIAFVSAAALCLVSVLLYRLVRRSCSHDLIALAITGLAMLASSIHWLARPHLASWILTLVFCHVAANAEEGNRRVLCWLPLLTLVWTNLHGGFLIGVLILVAYGFGELLGGLREAPGSWPVVFGNAAPYLLCAIACALASLVNPYGWQLHAHVLSYLRDDKLLDHIQEFQSPNFHSGSAIFFELLLVAGIASVLWCWERRRYAAAILTLFWAHQSLLAARNIPFFAFFAAPPIAALACDLCDRVSNLAGFSKAATMLRETARELLAFERVSRLYLASAAGLAVVLAGFLFHWPKFEAGFDAEEFPVGAISKLQAVQPTHLFTKDQWADYLIYRFFPSTRVFADGRSDFYGENFTARYLDILNAHYDWQTQLRHFHVDAVLVPVDCPLATALKETRGWKLVFDDGRSVLFAKAACAENRPEPVLTPRAEMTLKTTNQINHERRSV